MPRLTWPTQASCMKAKDSKNIHPKPSGLYAMSRSLVVILSCILLLSHIPLVSGAETGVMAEGTSIGLATGTELWQASEDIMTLGTVITDMRATTSKVMKIFANQQAQCQSVHELVSLFEATWIGFNKSRTSLDRNFVSFTHLLASDSASLSDRLDEHNLKHGSMPRMQRLKAVVRDIPTQILPCYSGAARSYLFTRKIDRVASRHSSALQILSEGSWNPSSKTHCDVLASFQQRVRALMGEAVIRCSSSGYRLDADGLGNVARDQIAAFEFYLLTRRDIERRVHQIRTELKQIYAEMREKVLVGNGDSHDSSLEYLQDISQRILRLKLIG